MDPESLEGALDALEKAISAPEPGPVAAPALSLHQRVERDEDGRVSRIVQTRSDGRVFWKTPYRDGDQRITHTLTTERPAEPFQMAADITVTNGYGPRTPEQMEAFRRDFEKIVHDDGHVEYRRRDEEPA